MLTGNFKHIDIEGNVWTSHLQRWLSDHPGHELRSCIALNPDVTELSQLRTIANYRVFEGIVEFLVSLVAIPAGF